MKLHGKTHFKIQQFGWQMHMNHLEEFNLGHSFMALSVIT